MQQIPIEQLLLRFRYRVGWIPKPDQTVRSGEGTVLTEKRIDRGWSWSPWILFPIIRGGFVPWVSELQYWKRMCIYILKQAR